MGVEAGEQRPVVPGSIERAGKEEKIVEASSAPVVDTAGPSIPVPWDIDIMKPLKESGREWNTRNLGQRLAVDAACAASAGAMVAPVVSMIDR